MKRKTETNMKAMAITLGKDPEQFRQEIEQAGKKGHERGSKARKFVIMAIIGFVLYKKFFKA